MRNGNDDNAISHTFRGSIRSTLGPHGFPGEKVDCVLHPPAEGSVVEKCFVFAGSRPLCFAGAAAILFGNSLYACTLPSDVHGRGGANLVRPHFQGSQCASATLLMCQPSTSVSLGPRQKGRIPPCAAARPPWRGDGGGQSHLSCPASALQRCRLETEA